MNRTFDVASIILAFLTVTAVAVAQDQTTASPERYHHTRYRLVDLGTLGGPQSYIPDGLDITATRILNNSGHIVGWADTSGSDPFPDSCWDDDCFVGHAFVGGSNGKKDLGVLPGGKSSESNSIAENGLVSGDSQNGEFDPLLPGFPEVRAVLWRHGHIIDLGTLDGGYESFSTSVNSRGQVTGLSTNTVPDPYSMAGIGYQTRAFVWQNGSMQDLGTLGSGADAAAALINERGQVLGWSYTDSNPSDICAGVYGLPLSTGSFLWERGKGMADLGGLGGSCTVATDLNEQGQVVGQSWLTGDLAGHAFRWDHSYGLVDLGTLGGDYSSATAINSKGEAVGGSYLQGNVRIDATLWSGNTAIDMGAVDSDECSYALSINTSGQVVGISGTTNCESTRAFLWEPGAPMIDLNSLASSKSGMYVASASAINERGEIAGLGVLPNGDEHAVLLVPCREGEDQACETDATNTSAQLFNPSSRPLPSPLIVPRLNLSRLPHRSSNRIPIPGLVSPATSAIPKMATAASDPKVFDDLLGDKMLLQYTVRGLCLVDPRSNKLTGGCVASQGLHCLGKRDAVNCPTGQHARRPEWVQMCVYSRPYVDGGRGCNAL